MKNKEFYQKIAELLKEVYPVSIAETGVEIVAEEASVEVRPSKQNTSRVFFSPETVVDFARLHKLSVYVSVDNIDDLPCAVAHLF